MNKQVILIALLVSTIFLIELEAWFDVATMKLTAITGIYISDKIWATLGIFYSVIVNIKALNGVTRPLLRAAEKSRWLKVSMITLHALSILMLLICLLFLPMAFSKATDY